MPQSPRRRGVARPRFIVVAGPPCSGKSTVARRLSVELGSPHLEMDAFRRRVLPQSDQRVEHRDIAYRAMHAAAELLAPWCATLVLDATYTAAVCRQDLLGTIERTGGDLVVVECKVDPMIAVQRFESRDAHPAVDLTADRVTALARGYPYFPGAYILQGDPSPTTHVCHLALEGSTRPMSRVDRTRWCRYGQPRERDDQRVSRSAAVVAASSSPSRSVVSRASRA